MNSETMACSKTFVPFLSLFFVLFTISDATDFLVGGQENAWKIPSSPFEFNTWAGNNRFYINDTLSFKYDGNIDSVLVVTQEDYENCNTTKPVQEYNDGDTKIELDRSGPFFFISGAQGHCQSGQKLIVVVISPNHWLKQPDTTDTGSTNPPDQPADTVSPAHAPAKNGGHSLKLGFVVSVIALGLLGLVVM